MFFDLIPWDVPKLGFCDRINMLLDLPRKQNNGFPSPSLSHSVLPVASQLPFGLQLDIHFIMFSLGQNWLKVVSLNVYTESRIYNRSTPVLSLGFEGGHDISGNIHGRIDMLIINL